MAENKTLSIEDYVNRRDEALGAFRTVRSRKEGKKPSKELVEYAAKFAESRTLRGTTASRLRDENADPEVIYTVADAAARANYQSIDKDLRGNLDTLLDELNDNQTSILSQIPDVNRKIKPEIRGSAELYAQLGTLEEFIEYYKEHKKPRNGRERERLNNAAVVGSIEYLKNEHSDLDPETRELLSRAMQLAIRSGDMKRDDLKEFTLDGLNKEYADLKKIYDEEVGDEKPNIAKISREEFRKYAETAETDSILGGLQAAKNYRLAA